MNVVSPGNKWFKLRYNLERALLQPSKSLMTFGGPHSNHLLATARACSEVQIRCFGVVRGGEVETPVMKACRNAGMTLIPISRSLYSEKTDPDFLNTLRNTWNNPWVVPEGGANDLGVHGAQDILQMSDQHWDCIVLSVGTGTTLAGMALKCDGEIPIIGISALKGVQHETEVMNLLHRTTSDLNWSKQLLRNVTWWTDAHTGGFGKMTPELEHFMAAFQKDTQVPLERVYTAKMFLRLQKEMEKPVSERHPFIQPNSRILVLHTGGISP
ncbi:MAG: 1-aminocyclopropane-1-carboxylate deaminase/D-cysteine desulfhydrase [Flavobacteriales bacterium]